MKKASLLTFALFSLLTFAQAQMQTGGRTLYGNEWINYDQTYYKIPVAKDGVYRISQQTLESAGISFAEQSERLQLFHLGEEVPIYVGENYIEFYGKQNRGELDRFLYENGEADMLNPEYSLITDTAAYFLTVAPAGTEGWRYTNVPNDLTNLPAPEAWYWAEEMKVFNNGVVQRSFNDIAESVFDAGEGYAATRRINQPLNESFATPHRFDAGIQDTLAVSMVGIGANSHEISIIANGVTVDQWSSFRYEMWQRNYTISNATEETNVQILDVTGRIGVGYLRLAYPRQFNFDNQRAFTFKIEASDQVKYLEIENFNAGNAIPVLYDLTNGLRIEATVENNLVKVKIPPSFQQRQFVLVNSQNGFTAVNQLQPITFQDFTNTDAEFIIISSKRLYDDGNGNNWVAAYGQYRASEAGGGYRTLTVEIEELYEQFAYGLNRHPLSIRNFAHFVNDKGNPNTQRYVFIIGKGWVFTQVRRNLRDDAIFYVPTFGNPGSDNLLLAESGANVPIFPIGRLAASTTEDIRIYLEKVQGHENFDLNDERNRAWRKEVLHLGGGGSVGEQNAIRSRLNQMKSILEQSAYGANVTSFFKTSTEVIQETPPEELTAMINRGAGVVTIFGHGGTDTFDFSIDDPSSYENEGRYHIFFSLGCNNGNFHFKPGGALDRSASEDYVLEPNKGAIAFIASSGFGVLSPLALIQSEYYRQLGASENIGRSIGEILRKMVHQLESPNLDPVTRAHLQQYSLHGDPTIKIIPYDAPDYVIERGSVNFSPVVIDTRQDSLSISFNVLNLGKGIEDSLLIKIDRKLPDESVFTALEKKIATPLHRSRLSLRLPTLGENAVGENRLLMTLNDDEAIEEKPMPSARNNNQYMNALGEEGASFYITNNSAVPIFPTPYAIVNEPPTLRASTVNSAAPERKYILEIDTTAFFNSPLLRREIRIQTGGLIEWKPSISWQDSTVYYWRISPDSTTQELGFVWNNSSLLYLENGRAGWNQSHHFQLKNNRLSNIEIPNETRKQRYQTTAKPIKVINGVYPGTFPKAFIGNAAYEYHRWNRINGLYIHVIDPETGQEWINSRRDYGSTAGWPTAAYPFATTNQERRSRAINFLNDVVPSGHYVLIFTIQNGTGSYKPEEWASDTETLGTNLFDILEAQGAELVRSLDTLGSRPYMFFYKKDDPSHTPFEKMVSTEEVIDETVYIEGNWDRGSITSVNVGPANNWSDLQWQYTTSNEEDQIELKVYGVRQDSTTEMLFGDLRENINLGDVNSQEFPLLRFEFKSIDEAQRTAPQLDYWRVYYKGFPDLALVSLKQSVDTVQQGQPLIIQVPIANTGNLDISDSLDIAYTITSENGEAFQEVISGLKPLARGESFVAELPINTRNLFGRQSLSININPDDSPKEQFRFNNIGSLAFFVKKDRRNPLLDVTFDGSRIMDGDLVSAKPMITISLEDENQFLLLSDTSLFSIFLEKPNPDDPITPILVPVNLNSDNIYFEPAESQKRNRATIEWQEEFTESGEYALLVQAKDVTGNASGAVDFKVRFNVITESQISNVLNYPNPFSTSTRFVYTLTGAEPPADYMIRIMTISGRIVRELTAADLGPLKVGTHQTDFAWDGTDAFGDRLANGVYLYQFIARDQSGNELAKYENGTDRFFKNNIGKLVILR